MLFCADSLDAPVLNGFSKVELEDGRSLHMWAKGYFFDDSEELWVDQEIVEWLSKRLAHRSIGSLIPFMNGCFSFIIYWVDQNELEVGIDRFGSCPIYYYANEHTILIGDEYWRIISRLSSIEYNPEAVMSMALLGHASGDHTLVLGVNEFSPASVHSVKLSQHNITLNSERYWRYSSLAGEDLSIDEWQTETANMIDRVFLRISRAINKRGWSVSVPLSSGHDSRLILGMFYRNGVRLSAFSYGPTGNQESLLASQIAQSLSVDFQFIPVDDPFVIDPQMIRLMTDRIGMKARFTTGLGGQLSLKSYAGDVVFSPGHPGNLPTGSAFERGFKQIRTNDQMAQHQLNNMSLPVFDGLGRRLFPHNWDSHTPTRAISGTWEYDPSDPIGSYVSWGWEVHVRGLLLWEMRTYDAFGHWILPYCDYEFVDFFAQVPINYLYQRYVFVRALLEDIYVKELEPLAAVPIVDRGSIEIPKLSWKDKLLLNAGPSIAGDYILKRATQSKHKEWVRTSNTIPKDPSGPDPIDYWWHNNPDFREFISDFLRDWDGMNGIVDVRALEEILSQPLPAKFVRYSIPSILTLCAFQDIVGSYRQTSDHLV